MIKVKMMNSTLSRTENGRRVRHSAGDEFKVTKKELKAFEDNLKVIKEEAGQPKSSKNQSKKEDNDKYTREELEEKNVTGDEGLRALGSDLGISDYNNMKKKELVKEILKAQEEE